LGVTEDVNRLTELLRRAKQILQTEGLTPLVRRGLSFVAGHILKYETYYLYEQTTANIMDYDEADYVPRIDGLTLKLVYTNEQADELEAEGFEFRSQVMNARERLDKGAIAQCFFVRLELVNFGWTVLNQQAKDTLHEPPYKVDFLNAESCGGNVWTKPEYRRMGIRTYGRLKIMQFLLDNGIATHRNAVRKWDIASKGSYPKFNANIYAEARYLKILWWEFWKETPLT